MVPAPNIHVHPEEFTRNSNHLKNIAGKSNVTNFFVLEDGEKSSQLYKLVTTAKSEGFNSSSNEATKKKSYFPLYWLLIGMLINKFIIIPM